MTWTTGEIAAANCYGSLAIGGVSLSTKAWAVTNLFVLYNAAPRRGENTLIPGLAGRIPHPKRKDEAVRTLELLVIGDCSSIGVPYSDRNVGLETNWLTLKNGLLSTTSTTLTAVLTRPSGSTLSGPVQIGNSELGAPGVAGVYTATLDLTLPNGELT